MSNTFDDYIFVYKDSQGHWNKATNPKFIAEHKACVAFTKEEWKTECSNYFPPITSPEEDIYEEAYINACESVGPNSLEFDSVFEKELEKLEEKYNV